jgi:hypothetical protein
VCWKPCSSCWSIHLLREEFLSAPIHSPPLWFAVSVLHSLTPKPPPSAQLPPPPLQPQLTFVVADPPWTSEVGDASNTGRSGGRALRQIPAGGAPIAAAGEATGVGSGCGRSSPDQRTAARAGSCSLWSRSFAPCKLLARFPGRPSILPASFWLDSMGRGRKEEWRR